MEIFNRRFIIGQVVFFSLLWLAIAIIALAFFTPFLDAAKGAVTFLYKNNSLYLRGMVALLGGFFILMSLFLLAVQFTSVAKEAVPVARVAGATAYLSLEAIGLRLRQEVEKLELVRKAFPSLLSRGGGVEVELTLHTGLTGVNLPVVTEAVCRVVRNVVQGEMKVRLLGVKVIFYPEAGEEGGAVRASG